MNTEHVSVGRMEALTFSAGRDEYALGILTVREIRGYSNVTFLASSPEFVKGTIDVQGASVPIVDIRIMLGFTQPPAGDFVVVIVMTFGGTTVGVVIDGISDVVSLAPEQIRPAPRHLRGIRGEHVMGLGVVGPRQITLVDMDRMLADSGLQPV